MNTIAKTWVLRSMKEVLKHATDVEPTILDEISKENWVEIVKCTIQMGSIDTLDMVQQLGRDINVTDMFGYTSLHHACMSGSFEMYKHFKHTMTTLDYKLIHSAAIGLNTDIIKDVANYVDINCQDQDDDTIFHTILDSMKNWYSDRYYTLKDVLEEILKLGFDCSLKNKNGYNSLEYFSSLFNSEFIDNTSGLKEIKETLEYEVNRRQKERILSSVGVEEVVEKRRRM